MAQSEVSAGGGVPLVLAAPNGLDGIIAAFGDIYEYIRQDGTLDPRWQADFLAKARAPFAMKLSWDPATSVQQITCHRRMVDRFEEVLQDLQARGLSGKAGTLGGCFAFRPQRSGSKLSTHAWGIAIDLNPATNAQGTAGEMDADVVAVFRAAGFTWGGEWEGKRRDPMHFQYCSGY